MVDQSREKLRPVRSYVIRGGRRTLSQQQAISTLWPRYGLDVAQGLIDPQDEFGRRTELVLEIGFGMGGSLLEMARQQPWRDFIGIDVHPPGVGALLRGIRDNALDNIRVFQHDAVEVLNSCIPDHCLARILVLFPDPWPKKRHHKRRLIQPDFIQLLHRKLMAGGAVHLATDWEDYAEHMLEVMTHADGFRNSAGEGSYSSRDERPSTKFERRGLKLGHGVWDLIFIKQ